jgi:3-deoxy-D-manno-octulosonic-acid transferase
MIRRLYTIAWYLAMPLALVYLLWRSRLQPEYRRHLGERFGAHRARADLQPLIWLHAVSVGETRAAQPLVAALLERYPGHHVLVTHMTPTGRETGAALFAGQRVRQAYLPYDTPFALRRFLRAWRPTI